MSEFIAEGEAQVNAYMLMSIRATLGMEARPGGMKFSNRVNVFQQAKNVLIANGVKPQGTKAAVYAQLNDLMVDAGFADRPLTR